MLKRATVAAGAVAILAAGAPAAAEPADVCAKGSVLARSGAGTLVELRRSLIACPRGQKPWVVATFFPPAGAAWREPHLRGPIAAFTIVGSRSLTYDLQVVDIRRRTQCYRGAIGTGVFDDGGGGVGDRGEPAEAVALRRDGALAYIAGPGTGPRPHEFPEVTPWAGYEVVVVDRQGIRQVAAGLDVVPTKLSIGSRSASWTQGGIRRTAPVGDAPRCRERVDDRSPARLR